ncbi:MAG: hypothetical protein A2521_02445 [Deltaproteobacteria bacterium RIFOXYD12_FULL_57_12]|nr:MAG: hypothetical protein A2521_02445 [Deltaproteobacteria bacterium RIFOXYD12_FULL_57_12]
MAMPCPVCKSVLKDSHTGDGRNFYDCQRCGPYSLSYTTASILEGQLSKTKDAAAKVSYALYRMTKREQWAMLDSYMLKNIIENTQLPRPQEQFENLVLWLGEMQSSMGIAVSIDGSTISASGATDKSAVDFLAAQAIEAGFVDGIATRGIEGNYATLTTIKLTLKGWGLFEELQRGKASGRNAFMAMQFGDPELDRIFSDHFKPAVKATDFDLKRLDEGQPAGLIDDRLRVEIRQSRFLIADLTHHNRGAYWEAGYAEGLGKPVIYTCQKDVFEAKPKGKGKGKNKDRGPHFDTNHHLTVVWDPDNLPEAVEKLKATIRATLPEEAKQSD